MSHTPHELAEEFPQNEVLLRELKAKDPHFSRLADEYHEVNRQIHRHESRVEPVSDFVEEELRKKRLSLKDEIASLLRQATD